MSQELLDELRVNVTAQQQRGAGVPEVVKADLRQPCPRQERRERTLAQVGRVNKSSDLAGEDEALILIEVAETLDVLHLAIEVLTQCPNRLFGKLDGTAALLRLRFA